MAATGKPKRYTERLLLTMEPERLSKLNEIAEADSVTRLEAIREMIDDKHARLRRNRREENDR